MKTTAERKITLEKAVDHYEEEACEDVRDRARDYTAELNDIPEEEIQHYLNSKRLSERDDMLRTEVAIAYYERNKNHHNPRSHTQKLDVHCYNLFVPAGLPLPECIELFKDCDIDIVRELKSLYDAQRSRQNQDAYDTGYRDALERRNCINEQ